MRHAIVRGGGGAGCWMWSQNGEGEEGVFQFVSHRVKRDMDGKMKAKHTRHRTTKFVQL